VTYAKPFSSAFPLPGYVSLLGGGHGELWLNAGLSYATMLLRSPAAFLRWTISRILSRTLSLSAIDGAH
jgi:hypothetical protein